VAEATTAALATRETSTSGDYPRAIRGAFLRSLARLIATENGCDGLPSGRTHAENSALAGSPRSGPAGAEGRDCLAEEYHHRRGAWRPRAYTLGLPYKGARMRPKKTSLRHVKQLPYPTRTRTTFEVPAENG
jgi:hypothetical protein